MKDCWVSKESLKKQLGMMENNMLVIADQYELKMMTKRQDLATIHGQALRNEQVEVLALWGEKEAREEVIELLHQESTKWMNRFELSKLLARAKAMANIYFTPDEVHSLFDYCQDMVELMTHIIRTTNALIIYFWLYPEAMY